VQLYLKLKQEERFWQWRPSHDTVDAVNKAHVVGLMPCVFVSKDGHLRVQR
ncbi:hypothetical protein Tco_1463760, partial [Tanacetum coccineum]